jgi:FixJ family two-component response regulator
VKTFGSAREFLASLPECSPQCVVLDIHMPEMTGLELQDRLAAQGSCVPVILMTAYDTPQTRQRARQAGGFGFLLKPFDKQALLNAVAEAVSCQIPGTPSR